MSNGRTDLDREGCEYGRMLAKDVAYLREDLQQLKVDNSEIKDTLVRIEKKISQYETIRSGGSFVIAALVSAIVNFIFPRRG